MKKIIVIDDEKMNRTLLKKAFAKEYETIEAENGKEGMEKILANQNDLAAIFLDIIMPVADGFTVLQEMNIRSLMQQIPVFLITSDPNADVVERAYDYGAVDVIPKPFNMMILKRRFENTIEYFSKKYNSEKDILEQDQVIEVMREDLMQLGFNVIGALCEVIESRSEEENYHNAHIRQITLFILEEFAKLHPEYGLKPEVMKAISRASVFHDLGKIFVSKDTIKKPLELGKLTPEEMDSVRNAPKSAVNFLNTLKGIPEPFYTFAKEICRYHMERWDGKGYPEGLSGNEIPLSAQIVSVAEVFDVLVTKRVYKEAYSHQDAQKMINTGECGAFNPEVLKAFNAAFDQIETVYVDEDY